MIKKGDHEQLAERKELLIDLIGGLMVMAAQWQYLEGLGLFYN